MPFYVVKYDKLQAIKNGPFFVHFGYAPQQENCNDALLTKMKHGFYLL